MADCIAYVQLLIQSVPVDQLLGTKIKTAPVLHVKMYPRVTRETANGVKPKTATLYHTSNYHPVLHV